MMTLDDLKQQELPVRLECYDGEFTKRLRDITVTGFNDKYLLVTDIQNLDTFTTVESLKHFKVKPKTKKVIIERWINVYPNGDAMVHKCKKVADGMASRHRLDCIHVYKEYEVEAE